MIALLERIAEAVEGQKAVQEGQNRQNDHIDAKITRKKPSKRLLLTIAWLKEHDPDEQLSREAVAKATGFSTGTVSNARRAIRNEVDDG